MYPGRIIKSADQKFNKKDKSTFLCNGGQHYVSYRWVLISHKLCDSTVCTCGGVGGGEEQVHNVEYYLCSCYEHVTALL
jgi:hypothetical protein